jgi:hypothetical protein
MLGKRLYSDLLPIEEVKENTVKDTQRVQSWPGTAARIMPKAIAQEVREFHGMQIYSRDTESSNT